ncbi:carbohydrate-binding module family 21 protein [Cystobasidium minutum MCA 4210]|uniref:carbohydrate-binding module family 21 protein n=1 Tax=Cystobasidium minutum MCA 4210 TaxID=1397322 RepID=UPI0034CDDE9B|eukprot:jgi/Rhomi1/197706/gm1.5920_g
MPYISPSLSPTRTFASPTSSGSSSPKRQASYSGSSSNTSSYIDGFPSSSLYGSGEYDHSLSTSSSSSIPSHILKQSSSSSSSSQRPPHRHHSRSHSSDTLVTMSNMSNGSSSNSSSSSRPPLFNRHSKSSKMTPDFIFVQPASPGPDELPPRNGDHDGEENGYYHSMPSSSARQYSYSHTTPSSSSSHHSSSSSSRPHMRRSSYTRQTASAVFNGNNSNDSYSSHHPYSYYGPLSPNSSTAGDEGDVPPPRSASSSNLHAHSGSGSESHYQRRRSARRAISASADSSPRHSISMPPMPRMKEEQEQRQERNGEQDTAASEEHRAGKSSSTAEARSVNMKASFSDSALLTSSSSSANSSANSSFNNSSAEDSESEESKVRKDAQAALSSPLLQKHKPSWGEIPTPTSMNSSTSFSFGQSPSFTSTNGSGSDFANGEESGSLTPTPKAEKQDPNDTVMKSGGTADASDALSIAAAAAAQPSTKSNGALPNGLVSDSPLSGSGSSSPTSGSGSGSSASTLPTSGPLAPAATAVKRRPHHTKAFSERSESPFRLEFESHQRERDRDQPSTHSRMTGLRHREASEGSNNGDATSSTGGVHFANGGLTVHTHHPVPHIKGEHHHIGHGPRSSSYRPSPLPTPMLRKKSGELVKSSMKHDSRAKSAPTTPTGPKAVHFDEQLERVKHFLAQQKPTAVSRDGSPVETETEDDSEANAFPFPPMTTSIPAQITLVLPDFPKNMLPDLGSRDLCLESLEIAADSKSLKGTALLRNLAFEKRLSIRFTFDDWQTVSEVTGEWQATLNGGQIDRWSFRIKLDDMLARIEDKKLYLALKYTVAGREIWDSNEGRNYKAEFKKQAARSQAVVGGSRAARHEWAVTNAGQANERMADLRRELDRLVAGQDLDDFSSADELVISSSGNANKGFKYQHRFLGGEAVPLAQAPASNTFSSRYDFGASLKQAASTSSTGSPANGTAALSNAAAALPNPVVANAALAQQQSQLLPHSQPAKQRGSPQSAHAILDNPYFAAPNASEAMINSWRSAASLLSPVPASQHSVSPLAPAPSPLSVNTVDIVSPQTQQSRLYADDAAPLLMTSSVIGGMPATTFVPPSTDLSASTPPASFSGSSYYPRTEADGVISQDFGLPNLMSYMGIGHGRERSNSGASSPRTEVPSSASSTASTATPGSYFPDGDPISSTNSSATNSTNPSVEHSPTTDFSGGAPLARQARLAAFPGTRSFLRDVESASPDSHSFRTNGSSNYSGQFRPGESKSRTAANDNKLGMFLHHGQRQHSGSSLAEILDASLMDSSIDPRDTSIYSPAISPRSVSPPISSSAEIPGAHQRRHSPPPRPLSPDDLLSPSPSSASTDTSISTPQSPGGSPPLRMYSPFIASAGGVGGGGGKRPDMGSDTYFNFVHRYCWGNGETNSSSSSSSSTSTALGLAGLNPAYDLPTPRKITPPSSCSASLLSSPTQSQSGSRTPSPKNLSPSLENVQRMESNGYMSGPPPVHI